ncbi:MAG: dihydrolipoyl dehydrogenase [Chloroflexi bacterium]|nr:dihydrolipoyl dehydrogenase [Chloroflexota bacterium]
MTLSQEYDVVVIGAGPGGYVAAIRAAQLGLKTALVERDDGTGHAGIGGVCLNWGCIPSKALLRNAELVNLLKRGEEFGLSFDNPRYDIGKAIDRSRTVVRTLVSGVGFLLKKNKVDVVQGEGSLKSAHRIEVKPSGQTLDAKNVIIATGAKPRGLPGLEIDGTQVLSSREALALKRVPPSIVIVGGGAVGVEFAYFYNAYGSKVTVLEMLPHLVPNEDEEISKQLESAFAKQGITVATSAKVEKVEKQAQQVTLTYGTASGEEKKAQCDVVLLGVGARPNSEGLGLEKLGARVEKDFIQIDDRMATTVPGVYAIGDVTGKLLLAHVASAQGVTAAEAIAGKETPRLSYQDMPRATYCQPQVASIGLTEAQAREQGHQVRIGKFPFRPNGKAMGMGETHGLVKLVIDAKYDEMLGAHFIGPEVTELLAEVGLLKAVEGSARDLAWTVHAHPTLSEAVKEAALAAYGEAIHA